MSVKSLGIDSLKFYTGDGKQIIMQKQYSCKWEIVPADSIYSAFMKNPSGHLELSPKVDLVDYDTATIRDGYVTTAKIKIKENCSYTVTVSGTNAGITFYGSNDAIADDKTFKNSLSSGVNTFIFSSEEENFKNYKSFSVYSLNNNTLEIYETSNLVQMFVDEPGEISPNVSFVKKARKLHQLFDYEKCDGNEISDLNSKNLYSDIDDKESTVSLSSISDILFFSYRYGDNTDSFEYDSNKIVFTINTGYETVSADYILVDFFRPCSNKESDILKNLIAYTAWNSEKHWLENEISTSNTEDASKIYGIKSSLFKQVRLTATDLDYTQETSATKTQTSAYYIMYYNVEENQFPYVRFIGTVYQDKISTNFIDPTTIIVIKDEGKTISESSTVLNNYSYPSIGEDDSDVSFRLHFRFEENSDMSFVTTNDNVNLELTDSLFALTKNEATKSNALSFTVGFQTDTEGCYVNTMGIFIRDNQTYKDYFLGVIRFYTEAEDEDERFRTLFTNFGIPDPIKYPNIFKEQDLEEEGTDWTIINKKSKELFLYYDQIFPYVGTYKALFNAIKYLGYQDIIFKEWYKIKDKNDNTRYVAIQNYDNNTGLSIRSSLKKYGVEYGEYERYTKLNRLSMIYHMQTIDEDTEEDALKKTSPSKSHILADFTIGKRNIYIPENYESTLYGLIDNTSATDDMWKNVKVKCLKQDGKYYLEIISGTFIDRSTSEDMTIESNSSLTDTTVYYISNSVKLNCCYSEFFTTDISNALSTNATYRVSANNSLNKKSIVINSDSHVITNYDYYNNDDIESIKNIYEYRTDEVLAKLYSVKHWLETYITGINCYISDINGEGIVLERIKTVGYVTSHEFKDITNEGKFTPHCHQKMINKNSIPTTDFTDSSTAIVCSLNEFNSVTFEDYKDYPIERFIKASMNVTVDTSDGEVQQTVYNSAPLSALTVADEIQYTLHLDDVSSGSLYEFADSDSKSNPIVINDGEITFWDQKKSISSIDSHLLPIIQISKGTLRLMSGSWSADYLENSNVKYSIYNTTAPDGFAYTIMKNLDTGKNIRCKANVTLSPIGENAQFYYSSQNKWEVPMFFIKGYKITNQYRQDMLDASINGIQDYSSAEDFFNKFNEDNVLILEIIKGDIKFRNYENPSEEKFCKSADVYFDESVREENVGEQIIGVKYTYESERNPVYTLTKKFNSKYSSFKDLYKSIENIVNINKDTNIFVNRLGNYTVSVKAYDAYNNIFTNKSDDICTVRALKPSIDIIVNSENSNNASDFYKENIDSSVVLSNEETKQLLQSIDEKPLFPIDYKIYGSEHNINDTSNNLYYDNISYAIDTPKANDYLLLTNLTERVYDITVSSSIATIRMKNNNLRKQNIYNASYVNLCIYDDNTKTILFETTEPCSVTSVTSPEDNEDTSAILNSDTNGQLTVRLSEDIDSELIKLVNIHDNNINMYVINASELYLENVSKIENDYTNHKAFIPIYNDHTAAHLDTSIHEYEENYSVDEKLRHFPLDTMIKISATIRDENSNQRMISEAAYRILDTSLRTYINGENSSVVCGYVIDGNIDINYLNSLPNNNIYENPTKENDAVRYTPRDISVCMKPLNTNPVQYSLRVNKDADEYTTIYGDYDYYGMSTVVNYNTRQLLFDSYFDDSYATTIMQFDPITLTEIWDSSTSYSYLTPEIINQRCIMHYLNASTDNDIDDFDTIKMSNIQKELNLDTSVIDSSLYVYTDYPVTIDQNEKVIVKSSKNNTQLEGTCKNLWKWKTMTIENNDNWSERKPKMENILLFESINDILSVKPYMLGSQSIELYRMDKYGNVIQNTGGGNLYVK